MAMVDREAIFLYYYELLRANAHLRRGVGNVSRAIISG
jgi:hypothetical protein